MSRKGLVNSNLLIVTEKSYNYYFDGIMDLIKCQETNSKRQIPRNKNQGKRIFKSQMLLFKISGLGIWNFEFDFCVFVILFTQVLFWGKQSKEETIQAKCHLLIFLR